MCTSSNLKQYSRHINIWFCLSYGAYCNTASHWKWPLFAVPACHQLLVFLLFPRTLWDKPGLSEAGAEIHVTRIEFVRAFSLLVFPQRFVMKSLKYTLYSFQCQWLRIDFWNFVMSCVKQKLKASFAVENQKYFRYAEFFHSALQSTRKCLNFGAFLSLLFSHY